MARPRRGRRRGLEPSTADRERERQRCDRGGLAPRRHGGGRGAGRQGDEERAAVRVGGDRHRGLDAALGRLPPAERGHAQPVAEQARQRRATSSTTTPGPTTSTRGDGAAGHRVERVGRRLPPVGTAATSGAEHGDAYERVERPGSRA